MEKAKDDNDYEKRIPLRESVHKQVLKSSFRKKNNKKKKKSVEFKLDLKISDMYDDDEKD